MDTDFDLSIRQPFELFLAARISYQLEIMTSKFGLELNGGADGTRTRDPRRDRPVF